MLLCLSLFHRKGAKGFFPGLTATEATKPRDDSSNYNGDEEPTVDFMATKTLLWSSSLSHHEETKGQGGGKPFPALQFSSQAPHTSGTKPLPLLPLAEQQAQGEHCGE